MPPFSLFLARTRRTEPVVRPSASILQDTLHGLSHTHATDYV